MIADTPQDDVQAGVAIAWFGESLGPGEWINQTWIGRSGIGEVRMLDIVCADASHRFLFLVRPSDEEVYRVDGLTYEELRAEVTKFEEMSRPYGFWLGEFAGAVTTLPE